jgi:hypothetical protein
MRNESTAGSRMGERGFRWSAATTAGESDGSSGRRKRP